MRRGAQLAMCRMKPDDVFVKTHNASVVFLGYPMMHQDLTAGAIYIVRNPLDVCISLSHHYGTDLDTTIDILADPSIGSKTNDKIVYEVHKSWSIHVDSWTNPPRPGLAVLRYEDMLNNPIKTFGGLSQFLGLNPPRKRLERAIERASFKTLRRQEDQQGFKEKSPFAKKFFRDGRAGQWRELLTPAQIDKLVSRPQGTDAEIRLLAAALIPVNQSETKFWMPFGAPRTGRTSIRFSLGFRGLRRQFAGMWHRRHRSWEFATAQSP